MHIPVLTREVLEYLDVQPDRNYIDATVNGGGHALAILERNKPDGKVLGIDWDRELISKTKDQKSKIADRLILAQGNFVDIRTIVTKYNVSPVHGILFDLGMSSWHIEKSMRGFSFLKDEPLDMRYSSSEAPAKEGDLTAQDILNTWPVERIAGALERYGEEQFAQRIARKIEAARDKKPIRTTLELVAVILHATPRWYHRRKTHPATKTFQALRMAVNRELENLEAALPEAFACLERGGRLVVISFHSLEDRVVKNFFQARRREGKGALVTKKPIMAARHELNVNPRSRSAKLRSLQKL